MEVLVSLALIIGVSLTLFKQQVNMAQLFNKTHQRILILSEKENAIERAYANVLFY